MAWFTLQQQIHPTIRLAISNDGGKSFFQQREVASGNASGRVDVAFREDQSIALTWVEERKDHSSLQLQVLVGPDYTRTETLEVARLSGSRGAGFPRLMATSQELLIGWTEPGQRPVIRVARVTGS